MLPIQFVFPKSREVSIEKINLKLDWNWEKQIRVECRRCQMTRARNAIAHFLDCLLWFEAKSFDSRREIFQFLVTSIKWQATAMGIGEASQPSEWHFLITWTKTISEQFLGTCSWSFPIHISCSGNWLHFTFMFHVEPNKALHRNSCIEALFFLVFRASFTFYLVRRTLFHLVFCCIKVINSFSYNFQS